MDKVLVSSENIRIVKDFGLYKIERKNESGRWERCPYTTEWYNFDRDVLNEFTKAVLYYK